MNRNIDTKMDGGMPQNRSEYLQSHTNQNINQYYLYYHYYEINASPRSECI